MAQLIWSPKSLRDLEAIHVYIQQDSEENARKFIVQLVNEIMKVTEFPNSGRVVPEIKNLGVREKIYKNYRIIYRIQENNQIELVTLLHQARRLNIKDIRNSLKG